MKPDSGRIQIGQNIARVNGRQRRIGRIKADPVLARHDLVKARVVGTPEYRGEIAILTTIRNCIRVTTTSTVATTMTVTNMQTI